LQPRTPHAAIHQKPKITPHNRLSSSDSNDCEAKHEYLDTNEWQVAGIERAIASLDRGKSIAHERVSSWIASWETPKERAAPKRV
jgi:predicted transcriptional regulator